MDQRYQAKEIEEKWQQIWENRKLFNVTEEKDKKSITSLRCFPIRRERSTWGA